MRLKFINNIGFILLAVYLILVGIAMIAGLVVPPIITGIVAIVAAIFILLGR